MTARNELVHLQKENDKLREENANMELLKRIVDAQTIRLQNQQVTIDHLEEKYNSALHSYADMQKKKHSDVMKDEIKEQDIMKKLLNFVDLEEDQFVSFYYNGTPMVHIPKVIWLLTHGGIIQHNDLVTLENRVSNIPTVGYVKMRKAWFLNKVIKFRAYELDILDEIRQSCIYWVCQNYRRLSYEPTF